MECHPRNNTANSAIIILGASGDLARRKLIPALARLDEQGEIDDSSIIIGSGRTEFTDEEFRDRFELTSDLAMKVFYHRGISGLKDFIAQKGVFDRIIVFMALPPSIYAARAEELAQEGFGKETNLIIEKPFGYNFESSRKMNREISRHFDENQIYRIDHYLAKEAVQNILVFRFANSLFYRVWNSGYIDSIQINAFEEIGVEERGAYFDGAGIIRDMVQNHLMQLLCLLTMESPVFINADEILNQKMNILKAITITDCCRCQYKGYREEHGVAPDSTTETYAEMKLYIKNFRWNGMPVHIRIGKALNRKGTEIGIIFKRLPKILFNEKGEVEPNKIIFKIQPTEGIIIDVSSKIPGNEVRITNTRMKFYYRDSFDAEIPEAYQKLLLDALKCDRTLFVSAEEAEISWQKFDGFLDKGELGFYERGTVPPSCLGVDWLDFDQYK